MVDFLDVNYCRNVSFRYSVCGHGTLEQDIDLRAASMGGDWNNNRSSDCADSLPRVALHHRLPPPRQQRQTPPLGERDVSGRIKGDTGDHPRRR